MRAIRALDGVLAGDAEPQPTAVPSASDVIGLRRVEPPVAGPAPQRGHHGGDLAEVGLYDLLQRVDAALPPLVDMRGRQPAQAEQHIDPADEPLSGQRRLRRPGHPLLQRLTCHDLPEPSRTAHRGRGTELLRPAGRARSGDARTSGTTEPRSAATEKRFSPHQHRSDVDEVRLHYVHARDSDWSPQLPPVS
ncbi:Conserved protein of uncharacterised function (part 1) [Mycobacterium tuberculosis]|uniref:Conserved protein of uncharacterized function (Part 1) n=1 Tax=Mycobacterium tuberculosis TaxID=1773 RepID=A0A655FMK3_MYCTX|nr:Conserved protein of uncharacterised function (part 1) [Mycobacterium tuberculosis]